MKCILVLALAACAHAVAPVPNYLSAYSNGEKGKNTLDPHLNGKPNKEYLALKAAVTGVAGAEVFLHLPYDAAYNFALLFAVLGRQDPVSVQKLSKGALALARGKTAQLRELVKKLCGLSGRRSDAKCNEYVDAAVKKDPKLQKQVPLFFGLGDLSYLYLEREPELVQAANGNVDEYLLNGKKKLRALIEQDAKVLRLLFNL